MRASGFVCLIALVASVPASGATLRIDHASKRFCVESESVPCPADVEQWQELQASKSVLAARGDLEVEVSATNTAAFAVTVTDEAVEPKDIAALKAFLGGLKPYLVEVPPTLAPDLTGISGLYETETPELVRLRKGLGEVKRILDEVRVALEGMHTASLVLVHGWNQVASTKPAELETAKNAVCERLVALRNSAKECVEVTSFTPSQAVLRALRPEQIQLLASILTPLRGHAEEVQRKVRGVAGQLKSDDPNLEQVTKSTDRLLAELDVAKEIEKAGWKLLEDGPALLKSAEAAEALATALVRASNKDKSKKMTVKWSEGRKITVKIAKRDASANTLPTGLEAGEWVFNVGPDNLLRFTAGLSLMFAPWATYDRFEEGQRVGTVDKRFLWALTLGVMPRCLDLRERRNLSFGMDFHLNPSESERAFGAGLFASWQVLKVSAGVVGIKHQYLKGTDVADTYSPSPYVSVAVVGWPPFEAK